MSDSGGVFLFKIIDLGHQSKKKAFFWNKPQIHKEFLMSACIGTSAELAAHAVAVLEQVSSTSHRSQSPTVQIYGTVFKKNPSQFLRQTCATTADKRPNVSISG